MSRSIPIVGLLLAILPLLLSGALPRPMSADNIDLGTDVGLWTPREREDQLWRGLITPYLADPLWVERDAYDAGHLLMVPLHAAFDGGDEEREREFAAHLERLLAAQSQWATNPGTAGQYFYLASRFVTLAADTGQSALIPAGLVDLLYSKLKTGWLDRPVKYRLSFANLEAAVDYKLDTPNPPYPYDRGIIDRELFTLAIAADLRHYERVTGTTHQHSAVVDAVLRRANRVFTQEVVWGTDGGWLLQPGVWSRHAEYVYAGRTEKVPGMKPLVVPGIGLDSSHSHRLPLWLTSLRDAYPSESTERERYARLLSGLETQLITHVLEPPTVTVRHFRMRNFMDGTNGVYRWNWPTLGRNQGYGPYELSGTLLYGWWSFLGSERVGEVYRRIAYQFPLAPDGLAVYTGPQSSREMHPIAASFATNGYAELIARVISR